MDLTGTTVPTWVMALAAAILTLCLVIGLPLAGMAGRRRGRRLANPAAFTGVVEKAKDTALFLAALLPSLLVWLAVMGVSFIGLTGFARTVLQWDHWTNLLVPLSLDGISISFGAWAFVAVKRGRHPGRAYKIVLAAAAMSAMLNFVHGRTTWSVWAGLYLAFLSFAGMAMFHELLDQFMASYDDELGLKTRYPRFGQRWLYAPFSTFAARRAWIVEPPRTDLRPSVRNALSHAKEVKEAKRQRRLGGAVYVQQEQQARLVEVLARNEVRAAKRGDLPIPVSPGVEMLTDPFSTLPPAPISPAVSLSPPVGHSRPANASPNGLATPPSRAADASASRHAAPIAEDVQAPSPQGGEEAPTGSSPSVHMRPQGKATKSRTKQPAPEQPELTGEDLVPLDLQASAEPQPERPARKPRQTRAERIRAEAAQAEAEQAEAAEQETGAGAKGKAERVKLVDAVVEDAEPVSGRAQAEVPWGAAFMGHTFAVPGVMPTLQSRVWEILDSQVSRRDDLGAAHVTEAVLKTLAVPANRDAVSDYIASWADEVQLGVRPHPRGPGVSIPEPDPAAAKAGYPFDVLARHPITIGSNVVTCPSCDTTATLVFSGLHPRRPVEATCGCGQRWAITGLGSTRVWDVLAAELVSGNASLIGPEPLA